jgi:hypothetical protein
MGSMWALLIMEGYPGTDPVAGFTAAGPGVQIDALVFQGSPWPFDAPASTCVPWSTTSGGG